jgi:hypothetical protein
MNTPLSSLVTVQAGHPFRGTVVPSEGGNALALQMRDVALDSGIQWKNVVRTRIEPGKNTQWLQPADVVFVARGARNHAVCLQDVPERAVCSQYFFLLRIKSSTLLAAFLAWQINRAPAQRYLASNAEGTDQRSIRRAVLEALPIVVPPIHQQQLIVALSEAQVQERRHLEALIRNRQRQLDALAFDLFAHATPALREP